MTSEEIDRARKVAGQYSILSDERGSLAGYLKLALDAIDERDKALGKIADAIFRINVNALRFATPFDGAMTDTVAEALIFAAKQ